MKIIILGGDGFCGWPTSLHLASSGHTVLIVDNLIRRKIDTQLGSNSLTQIETIESRIKVAKEIFSNIEYININRGVYCACMYLKVEITLIVQSRQFNCLQQSDFIFYLHTKYQMFLKYLNAV